MKHLKGEIKKWQTIGCQKKKKKSTRPIILIRMYVSIIDFLTLKIVTLSFNYPLSLRIERFVSGTLQNTEQLCPRYRHKSVSGSRVGHKSLSFSPTGQKSAHLGDFQPAYIMRLAFNIIHLSIYIFIFRYAYWGGCKRNLHICLI